MKQFMFGMLMLFVVRIAEGGLDSGLVARYNLDGNVFDSLSTYNGTTYGNPQFVRDFFYRPNSSLSLNGTNQFVTLPAEMPITRAFSLSFWIRTSASNPNNWDQAIYLFDKDNCATNYDWNVSIGLGGKIIFSTGIWEMLGGGTHRMVSTQSINDNKWHHVVIACSGPKTIYIDGIKDVEDYYYGPEFQNSTIPLFIGASDCNLYTRQKFRGELDEIRIYNRHLSDSEAKRLFRGDVSYIRFIPQGLYNPQTKMLNRCDSVTIYVRVWTMIWMEMKWVLIDTIRTVIDSVTFVAPFQREPWSFVSLEVRHKGSISTWSVGDYQEDIVFLKDFVSGDVSYMANEVQVDAEPVRFAAYSGDLNSDGIIDASDQTLIENVKEDSRDLEFDLNGDGFVDNLDLSIVEENAFKMIEMKYYPEAELIKYP